MRELKKEVELLRHQSHQRSFEEKARKTPTKQNNSPKAHHQPSPIPSVKTPTEPKKEEKSRVETEEVEIPKPEMMEVKPVEKMEEPKAKAKPQDKSHSADTDKLLEVLDDEPNLNI